MPCQNFDTLFLYNFVVSITCSKSAIHLMIIIFLSSSMNRGCICQPHYTRISVGVPSILIESSVFNAHTLSLLKWNSVEMKLNFIQNIRQCSWNTCSFQVVISIYVVRFSSKTLKLICCRHTHRLKTFRQWWTEMYREQ